MRNQLPASFFTALVCCWAFLVQACYADEPIPNGQDALTQNDVIEINLKFRVSFAEEYKQQTMDEENVQEAAANFLHEYAYTAAEHVEKIDYAEVHALGVEAIKAGSTDPLVELYHARTTIGFLGSEEGLPKMVKVADRLRKSPYRRFHWMLCEIWKYSYSGQYEVELESRTIHPELIQAVVACLQEKPQEEIDRRVVWIYLENYLHTMSGKDLERLRLACSKANNTDPWLTHMLAGFSEERKAWNTSNMGKTLPPAIEQRRRKAMQPARQQFLAAWKLYPQYPEAASHMISIAMLNADERTPRYWFDQAVAAQMDLDDAYHRMYLAYSPRWGGSVAKVWKFGLECRDTERFDTLVPGKMVKALNLIDREVAGETDQSWAKPGVYEACVKMMAGYEAEYKRPKTLLKSLHDASYFRSMFAGIAVRAEQHADARIWFDMLGDEFSGSYYRIVAPHNTWHLDRSRVYALTSPVREELLKIEHALAETTFEKPTQVEEAIKQLGPLYELADQTESAAYFTDLRKQYQRIRDHFDNRWRELPFMGETAQWEPQNYQWGDQWKVENRLSLVATQVRPEQFMITRHPAPFPLPYEVEVQIESLDKPGLKTFTAPGILIDKRKSGSYPQGAEVMRRKIFMVDQPHSAYGAFNLPGRAEMRSLALPKVNTLRVKIWPGHYVYYLNGALMAQKAEEDFQPRPYFSLANYPLQNGVHKVRFLNPRIKPLHYGPPPTDKDPEPQLKYYTRVIEADPEDGHAYYMRADILQVKGEIQAAQRDYEKGLKLGLGSDAVWAHHGLADTYAKQEKYEQQLEHYRIAFSLVRPEGHWIYQSNIAWLMATCPDEKFRNGAEAVKLATAAAAATKNQKAIVLGTLAAAHAEAGNFDQAIVWTKKAIQISSPADLPERKETLKRYEAGQPYRDLPKQKQSEQE